MSVRSFLKDLLYIKDILIVVLTPLVLIPLVVDSGPESRCAYVVIIMAVYWITEALPISVTAFLPVFMFPFVGIASVKATSQQYINDTSMLFIGGLIVAAAIEHWDIHKRIALRILLMVGSDPKWLMIGLMAPTWFLSMWISNTATTAMMLPITNAILMQLKQCEDSSTTGNDNEALELDEADVQGKNRDAHSNNGHIGADDQLKQMEVKVDPDTEHAVDQDDVTVSVAEDPESPAFTRLCKCLSLAIAYSANVGGIGSLTGTGPNLVMQGQLDKKYEVYNIQSPITFANWMAFGVPTSFVLVILVWVWLQIFFLRCGGCCSRPDKEKDARVKAVIRQQYDALGPISFGQGAVIGHFIVLAILWITRDLGGEYGWGTIFKSKYVKDGVPAVLVSCFLFVFPSTLPRVFCARGEGSRSSLKPLLSWKVAVEKVPWGVVFLLGGGFAMAHASETSGLSKWVGDKLAVLDHLEPWVLNLVLCYIVAAMTEVTSNTATCTLMMPILADLAITLNLNPMYLMFPTAIATSFAFMLPVATPPNALVFSYGRVRVLDMVLAGFMLNIMCVLFLIGSIETLGQSIFDLHTVPEALRNITAP